LPKRIFPSVLCWPSQKVFPPGVAQGSCLSRKPAQFAAMLAGLTQHATVWLPPRGQEPVSSELEPLSASAPPPNTESAVVIVGLPVPTNAWCAPVASVKSASKVQCETTPALAPPPTATARHATPAVTTIVRHSACVLILRLLQIEAI